jgi:hypothetical protein
MSEMLLDFLRVLVAIPAIERRRRHLGLHESVALSRSDALKRQKRNSVARMRLRRVIAVVDSMMPDGANCVRRSLTEMALDAGAAEEPLYAGLRRGGGARSGHAWLKSQPVTESYDVVVSV